MKMKQIKTNYGGSAFMFMDELPKTATKLIWYNKHKLDKVYIDYNEEKVYLFVGRGKGYREALPRLNNHGANIIYNVRDANEKQVRLSHSVLFNL